MKRVYTGWTPFIRRLSRARDNKLYREAGNRWAIKRGVGLRKAKQRFRPLILQRRLRRKITRQTSLRLWHRLNVYSAGWSLHRLDAIRRAYGTQRIMK
jgi:hypothetical protein